MLKILTAFVVPAFLILTNQAPAQSNQQPATNWSPNRIFLTAQPLSLGAIPYGGLRVGGELTLGSRIGLSNDFTWRFLHPVTTALDEGERDFTQGFQIQPELRFYLGVNPQSGEPGKRAFRGSLGLRSGYSRYHTEVSNWTFLTDASGQPYEKLVGYTRRQQNFDMSAVWNQKIYFNRTFEGFGMEVYGGLGLRMKRFHYVNVSPELDPDQIRREDESRMFSLRRDGIYPLLPIGFRLFYLIP
jgi:hypothetical protein